MEEDTDNELDSDSDLSPSHEDMEMKRVVGSLEDEYAGDGNVFLTCIYIHLNMIHLRISLLLYFPSSFLILLAYLILYIYFECFSILDLNNRYKALLKEATNQDGYPIDETKV